MDILVTVSGSDIFVTFTLTLTIPCLDFSFNTLRKEKKKIWTWKSFKKLGSQSSNQSITVYLQSALFPPYCAWAIQLTLQKEGEKVNTPRHLLLSSKPRNYTLQILHSYSIISFHKSAYFVKNSTNFPNHDTSVVNGFLIA